MVVRPVRVIRKTQLYSDFILQWSKVVSLLMRIFPTQLAGILLRPNLLIKIRNFGSELQENENTHAFLFLYCRYRQAWSLNPPKL